MAAAAYQILTMLAVMVGWVLFRADNLTAAGNYLMTMFGLNGAALVDTMAAFHFREYLVPLAAGILCSTPLFRWLHEKAAARGPVWENDYFEGRPLCLFCCCRGRSPVFCLLPREGLSGKNFFF